ncbi:hypothetical protein F-liban_347 [Faustovirus]|nr:hypothetical protein F-liban_347 [Faustovirus]SME65034.1 Hypothetical protein FSTVST1_337 [Faustovirus ST1]
MSVSKPVAKPTFRQRVFNLDTLYGVFAKLSFGLDVTSIAVLLYTGVEGVTIGWLQTRKRLPLIRYTSFVKSNYYTWLLIAGCWVGSLVFGAAARTVTKYIHSRDLQRRLAENATRNPPRYDI